MKILVVEDEQSYQLLLKDQLAQSGYKVIGASDGEKGLSIAIKEQPNLILLDLRMPKMDGMTMLDLLRQDAYGKSAKVIILTNFEPDDKVLQKVVADKPTYYFIKSDIKLDDLLEKIKELLS